MIKNKRTFRKMKNESCDDPRELLLSLVDLGSIDTDEMLIACVSEMSDAECKRVLNSLSLPSNSEEVEDEWSDSEEAEDADVEPSDDLVLDDEEESSEEPDEESEDEDQIAEVESRIRRLERIAKRENRIRSKARRKVESRKFEGLGGLKPYISEWFWENRNVDSYKGEEDEWLRETQLAADEKNEDIVSDCIEDLVNDYNYDQERLENRTKFITTVLAGLATKALKEFNAR